MLRVINTRAMNAVFWVAACRILSLALRHMIYEYIGDIEVKSSLWGKC